MKKLFLLLFGLFFALATTGQTVERRAGPGISFPITRTSDVDSLVGKPYRLREGRGLSNEYWPVQSRR